MRRIAGVLAVATGLTLIGFALLEHVPSRSSDAERISDHYRPLMSASGLAELHTGFDAVKSAGAELGGAALPRLQKRLGMDQQQFDAYVHQQLPGIAAFDANAPA